MIDQCHIFRVLNLKTRTEITSSIPIVDDYRRLLQCKSKCEKTLSTMYGTPRENYLREHYNYLQYAYYKGMGIELCQTAINRINFFLSLYLVIYTTL